MIRSILFASVVASSLALTACGGDASCEKVAEHMHKLLPAEMAEKMPTKELAAQCEKDLDAKARKCVLAAKTLEEAAGCDKK